MNTESRPLQVIKASAPRPANQSIKQVRENFQGISFSKKIDHILNDRCLNNTRVGIKITSLKTGEVVYEHNADELFIPASNMKLLTTAAALTKLKPEYKFRTTVAYDGVRDGGTINGNLYIKGFGDPKLVTEELLFIVREIRDSGLEVISGDIIADDSFFDNKRIGSGWKTGDSTRAYNARIGALSLNFNTIKVCVISDKKYKDKPMVTVNPPTNFVEVVNKVVAKNTKSRTAITVDRIEEGGGDKIVVNGEISGDNKKTCYYRSISNPPIYTATVFKEFLEREGITIKGDIKNGIQPADAEELLNHESVPLSIIVRDLNKISNNFIAEQILKTMGAEVKGAAGTTENGLAVVEEYLDEIGIKKGEYSIADGSGLSQFNRLKPSQIIKVLEVMYNDFKLQPEYTASLSVIGIDGSLKERANGSMVERMVRGKTGTLDGVSAISGYAACSACNVKGTIFAFSIILNGFQCEVNRIWNIQNQIISVLINNA